MFTSYIICATPRTGSTLLCNLLASTKTTGRPDSYYHRAEYMRAWAAEWKLSDEDTIAEKDFSTAYLAAVLTAGKAGTGIFGLRLQREYLDLLSHTLDKIFPGFASDAERFARAFGKVLYIHLTRDDKVAQAVSLVKAEQTGLWHIAPDGTELERVSAPQDPRYDFERIFQELSVLEAHDAAWRDWFAQQEINPLQVHYEALAEDPAGTLMSICRRLGVEAPEGHAIIPGVAKLSDEASLEWIRRFQRTMSLSSQR